MTPPDRPAQPAPDLDALFRDLSQCVRDCGGDDPDSMEVRNRGESAIASLRAQLAERDKRVAELERNAAQDAKHMERERQLSLNNLNASALLAADKRAAEARVAALEAANTRLREALGFCRELADHIAKAPIPVFRAHAIKARDCIDNALKGEADT